MNRRRPTGLQPRRSPWRALLGVLAATSLASGLGWAAWRGYRHLTQAERFAVRQLEFNGLSRASQRELVEQAGLVAGANILSLDLEAAGRAMASCPWVREARVSRRFPDTLVIQVQEYVPAALAMAGGLYAVDATGMPFKRVELSDGLDLPLVTGLERAQLEQSGGDGGALRTALRLMEAWRRAGLETRAALSELHVEDALGEPAWTLYAGESAVRLHLGPVGLAESGPDAPGELVGRLVRVWDELDKRGVRPRSIDLGNRQRPEWVAARVE